MITAAQRKARRGFLGSSDTPVIMGLSPYKNTPSDIYWSKVADVPDESADYMDTGNWLEGPLIDWAAAELGVKVIDSRKQPKAMFHVAEDGEGADLFCANHDALVIGKLEGIEAKFANGELAQAYGEPGSDQVAYHVTVQVQHQMYASDLERVYVALAVPSYFKVERRLYCVPRDDELIRMIVDFGCRWWAEHIETKTPPDGETTPPLYVLKTLERKAGAQIRLPNEAVQWADQRTALKDNIKALAAEVETLDARLIHALGEAEIGVLTDGRKVTFKTYLKDSFDSKRFKLDHPELAADYIGKSLSNTGVRISNLKK